MKNCLMKLVKKIYKRIYEGTGRVVKRSNIKLQIEVSSKEKKIQNTCDQKNTPASH